MESVGVLEYWVLTPHHSNTPSLQKLCPMSLGWNGLFVGSRLLILILFQLSPLTQVGSAKNSLNVFSKKLYSIALLV